MKEKHKYHIWDYVNIIVFYTIFACFFISSIMGIVQLAKNEIGVNILFYRISLTILMCLPYAIKKIFRVSFSKLTSSIYYLYMFLAGFLGVVLEFYSRLGWWDILIHFLLGLFVSVLSIYILNLTVYKKDTSKHNMFFTLMFIVVFAVAIGAIWEILEFFADSIFGSTFQRYATYSGSTLVGRSALIDTMVDIMMDFAGALTGVIFVIVATSIDHKFLKTFKVKKLRPREQEIEDIEE